jgi:hypothetical protein
MSLFVWSRCARRLVGLAAVVGLLLLGRPAAASEELRGVLRELAAEIKKALKGEGAASSIALGEFTGPATFPTSAGPSIKQVLIEELKKEGVTVEETAKFGVTGSYSRTEKEATNPDDARIGKKVLAVKLKASLVDSFDNPVGNFTFTRTIPGEATFLELIPVPVSLPPDGTELQRDKDLRDAFKAPKINIKGSEIRSDANRPYALEILVEGKPREAKEKKGLAFVPIQRGEAYTVRLINNDDLEAAVQLRIDGLSMFTFSELRQPDQIRDGKGGLIDNPNKGEPRYSVVIVAPKSKADIPGWHVNNKKSDSFLVTEFAKSGAALLKPTGDIGTISATFQKAWDKNADPPRDEPGKKRGVGSGDATGRGPEVAKEYKEVQRELGVIRDSISVRYTREAGK